MVNFLRAILNGLVVCMIFLLLMLGIFTIAIQFPAIQTWAVKKATDRISAVLGYPIHIGQVNIKWFDILSLQDVSVRDNLNNRMIDVDLIDINIDLKRIIRNRSHEIHLNEVTLFRPEVRLRKNARGDLNMDEFIARINEVTGADDSTSVPNQNIPFTIGKALLHDGTFHFDDTREVRQTSPRFFDHNHFVLGNIDAQLNDFLLLGDTIAFQARDLTTIDRQTRLKVHSLDTKFMYCIKKIELANLNAHIGKSHLSDYISFNYDRPADLSDFNQKIRMRAHFAESRIHSDDLGLFENYLLTLNEVWRLSGDFDGTVENFQVNNTRLQFGKNSELVGDFRFKGLPAFSKTTMDFRLDPTQVQTTDLVQYYPETDLHKTFQKFGLVTMQGTFNGTPADFDLKGAFVTDIGQIVSDLNFHLEENQQNSTYKGKLQTVGLDLGILAEDSDMWQKMDFSGSIDGKGFELNNASTHLDATISRLGFQHYDHKNIALNGRLQKAYFDGQVSSLDTNLLFHLKGEFDFTGDKNSFEVKGIIGKANLAALGISKNPMTFRALVSAKLTGNEVDELVGQVSLLNSYLLTDQKERNLIVDSVALISSQLGDIRTLRLQSEMLEAEMKGNFVPTQVYSDLKRILKEYQLYFFTDKTGRNDYYRKKSAEVNPSNYELTYNVTTHDLSSLFEFWAPSVYVSPNSSIEGVFRLDKTSFLTLNAQADTLRFGKQKFISSEIDLTTSKFVNSAQVLASALITSRQQQSSLLEPTEKLEIEANWDEDHIDFRSGVRQINSTNRANLNGEIRFLTAGLDIQLTNSRLNLLNEVWMVNPNNLVSLRGKELTFKNLSVMSENQHLSLNGKYSTDSTKDLEFDATNFKLATLNPVLNTSLGGVLDGKATLRDGIANKSVLNTDFKIESLSYNSYELGNLTGSMDWDEVSQQLYIDSHLDKNTTRSFSLTGTYQPGQKANSLNLKAVFNNTELKIIEPFSRDLLSDVSGRAQGTVFVKGTPDAPLLDGEVKIEKGKMKFDYLQSVFTFSDKIYFTESEITTRNMLLTDADGNTAVLRGGVFHDRFNYFSLDFKADLKNFKILDTGPKDNDLFYGSAYATGKVNVFGPINDLTIEASVTSNKGTRIYIPFDGATEVSTQDYIQFVSQLPSEDSTEADGRRKRQPEGGIKMDFNFNITPDAYCEIQLDRQAGDVIKAYGTGLLNMKIDTKGDFTMSGNYEITRGDYTFTFQNALNKKFDIKPGSRITWSGNPYDAILNVKAGYTQLTSLDNVMAGISSSTTTPTTRRYPVEVIISLTNRLMTPEIGYEIQFKEYPVSSEYRSAIAAFENRLRSDEQELSLQVSSLLLFSQLRNPLQDQTAIGQSFLGNSISELVSNQISKWASEIDQNLEVGVTGISLDQSALNNVQLRLSYRFLNDRFRITRDGRFTYGQNQYDATSLLGEWTLEYWMTRSGNVRLKAYNRNIQNPLLLNNNQTTGGISMQFTRSFNRFKIPDLPRNRDSLKIARPDSTRVDTARKVISGIRQKSPKKGS